MKLKLKNLNLGAGRPVVLINAETARKMNVHIGDRLEIRHNGSKLVAVTDTTGRLLKHNEISLSEEIMEYIKPRANALIDVNLALEPRSNGFIHKKILGEELSKEEIHSIIKDIVNNSLTEVEIAYFISGVYQHGMTFKETAFLTESIIETGVILKWDKKIIADKHCIGGIPGNRTTPIVVAICAAAGLTMPKTSSRAITSAAGTADTMETVTHVDFPTSELKKIVKKTGACLAWGGSLGIAPADDKLIRVEHALNIDPEAQLIASIIAKKIAAGSNHIIIDIPCGDGAKVSEKEARELKNKFMAIAKHFKVKMEVIITDGSQPIGNGIGPYLEMRDVFRVLRRHGSPRDLEEKSILLAGTLLELAEKAKPGHGATLAREILYSGQALKKFEEIINAQGRRNEAKIAKFSYEIKSANAGKIKRIDNKLMNYIARTLGCPVDKSAGIYLHKHRGDSVTKGEVLLTLYSESSKKLQEAVDLYRINCCAVIL